MLHEVELVYRKTYDEDDPVMLQCFSTLVCHQILAKFVQEMNYQSKKNYLSETLTDKSTTVDMDPVFR